MGRKPAPRTDTTPFALANEEAVAEGHAALTEVATLEREHEAAVRQLALRVGYELPAGCTDPDLIQRDIAANMRRSVEACLEVGRGLAVLKEACEHGQFIPRLNALGIEASIAQRFMQAAIKFSNAATSQHFTKAIGTQSKLFELLVLDDEQVDELQQTGQTGSLALDDVASMSVKELREALRKERETRKAEKDKLESSHKADLQAKDRLMAGVRERANKAEEKLAQLETRGVPTDERLNELTGDIHNLGKKADDALILVERILEAIDQVVTDIFDRPEHERPDTKGAVALVQRARDQGFRLASTVGRIQAIVDNCLLPQIEAREMYQPYTAEDGRALGDELVG
ncbi:MAG: hypothetical protein J0L85_13730 [Zoogloea sp.]|nr:hypothetical protein [Zoogloea sp.]MCA0188596.1 hypothetical protein [Pseudomonadota bacterium]